MPAQFVTRGFTMPLEPEELSPDQKLYDMIDKVVIVKGTIPSDPTIWEFHILGQILKVDTENLENMNPFRKQFLKVFDRPAPKIKLSRWPSILEALAEEKAECIQAPEESKNVFIARQIFEIVCSLEISDDAEDAESGRILYKHVLKEDNKPYLSVPSKAFLELVDRAGFKIPPNELSKTMFELGMKREATTRVSYCGKQLRSWCFIPEVVLREKGE